MKVRGIPTEVYIVLCQYEGCEECSSGAHIVGAYLDKKEACPRSI